MADFEARKIIEALRSGIPSRTVGTYFSDARPSLMKSISDELEELSAGNASGGLIITGRYGEGKTHLLNAVFNMAASDNMVVSLLPVSKETPFDKLHVIYRKLIQNTYLPGREQPGFSHLIDEMAQGSPAASDLMLFAAKELETDKLYYLLQSALNTDDTEEKYRLIADLEGDFVPNGEIKKIYRRIFGKPVKYSQNFSKTKHMQDYYAFMSRLFQRLGYQGWVILIDEAELIGRLGKKSRIHAYENLSLFLTPGKAMQSTYSIIAFSASYAEDVIDGKHEFENLQEIQPDRQEPAKTVLNQILRAKQLQPLSREEITQVIGRICEFYSKAYDWTPAVPQKKIIDAAMNAGYLLRTRLRCAIEILDQLYQYGEAGDIRTEKLSEENYSEETEVPSLEGIL